MRGFKTFLFYYDDDDSYETWRKYYLEFFFLLISVETIMDQYLITNFDDTFRAILQ